LFYIFGG